MVEQDSSEISAAQLRMGRAALGWTVRDLAERSSVHRNTITRIESGADAERRTLSALRVALERGGLVFIQRESSVYGEGVRLSTPEGLK